MKTSFSSEQLADKLVREKHLESREVKEVAQVARRQRKSVFQLIMEKELLKEEAVISFLSSEMEIPQLNLSALRISKDVIKMVPKKIAEKYRVVPLSRIHDLLTVATSDPFDLMLQDDLKGLTRCEICLVLAPPKMISQTMDNYYSDSSNLEEIIEGLDEDSLEVVKEKDADKKSGEIESAAGAQDAPVIRMVNLILSEAIRMRASDVHFEPYEKEFRIRYRIDGALKEAFSKPRDLYGALVARIKIMSLLDITEKRLPQDGRFRVKVGEREIDLRVSILPIYYGEKIVLRVLDRSGVKSGLENLGFAGPATRHFGEAIKRPYGMILVTGPTGSGKSTTLYTILNTMNTPTRNIMTIEDPVEYQIEGITQSQVQAEVGLTFPSGLRSLLRQSPDIILVGEIRDSETADIAVKAALTGHLVFSTLHTNSAAGAMTRLVDMGVEPFLIASSVICVAAQRLLRRVCPHCKTGYQVPEEVIRRCPLKESEVKSVKGYKGKGCAKCNNTGYFGRLGAIEVLRVDPEVHDLVLQRKSSDVIEKAAIAKGMETLFENAFNLFKNGFTTLEEVLRVTSQR